MYINKNTNINKKENLNTNLDIAEKTNTKGSNQYFINKEIRRIKSKIEKLELTHKYLENEVSNVRLEMEKEEYSTDYIKLKEMQDCIDNKNTMIEEKMIMWEELGEELRKYTK